VIVVSHAGASHASAYNQLHMRFEELLSGVAVVRRAGPSVDRTHDSGVEYDSRRVGPGSLFLAMQGGTTDGNRYIDKAIAQGAAAVVTDSAAAFADTAKRFPDVAVAEIPAGTGRRALVGLLRISLANRSGGSS
jgi:UDP-N-acetylmuramoyl-L-alanyl-D-glutamate--2,6-diaminopimelate ligase